MCSARVEVQIIGLAGSIASVVAMAANKGKLTIARNAFMMIHEAEGIVCGSADEIRDGADLVDKYTGQIVDIYSQRTGKTPDEINALIADGDYWMSGDECVAQGFADSTFNDVAPVLQIAARLDTNVYKNIPAQIRAQLKPSIEEDSTTKILTAMTKLGEKIANLFKSHKPAENADASTILNQVGEIMKPGLDEFETGIETTITNKVNEGITSQPVKDAIAAQVKTEVDFSKEGPAKVALDAAVTVAVENATKDYSGKITALETANATLEQKNKDLEKDIINLKGGKTTTASNQGGKEVKPIGQWNGVK